MEILYYLWDVLLNTLLILLAAVVPWIVVALIMQFLSNSIRKSLASVLGIQGYIYLTCPGVMAHELGHALFCIVFRHKIVEMKLFSPEEDGTLGYVNHVYNPKSIYQRIGNFFIGTGPVWFGIALLWGISCLLLPAGMLTCSGTVEDSLKIFFSGLGAVDFFLRWQTYLWLYLALTIASHITLSPPDLAGAADGASAMIGLVLFCCLCFGWCGDWEMVVISICKGAFLSVFTLLVLLIAILLATSIFCLIFFRRR